MKRAHPATLKIYQVLHGLLGLSLLTAPFFSPFAESIPFTAWQPHPVLVLLGFAAAASFAVLCSLPVLPGYFISFDAAIVLTLLFSGAFEAAAWVAALVAAVYALRRIFEGAPWQGVLLQGFENAGNRALRYLAGAWVYKAVGGSIPLTTVVPDTHFFDPAGHGWGPPVLAMATILLVNNLFFLPSYLLRGKSLRAFLIGFLRVDAPLTFAALPLGIIGAGVYTETSPSIYVLLTAAYLALCFFAMRYAKINERLRRNLRRIEAFAEANDVIATTPYARALAYLIGDAGQRLVDAGGFVVASLDPMSGRLSIEHAVLEAQQVPPDVYMGGEKVFREVLAKRRAVVLTPHSEDLLYASTLEWLASIPRADQRSFLLAPMFTRHGAVGVLAAIGRTGEGEIYTEDDAVIIHSFAHQAAISFMNARLLERATVDDLTQVYMRHYFLERLREFAHEAMSGKPFFAVALGDIDKLKEINDTHGHSEGDRILMNIADILRQGVPPAVMVSRYGGDEFALLIPDATEVKAIEIVEAVRQAVAAAPETAAGKQKATLSFGVAVYPPREFLEGAPTPGTVVTGLLYEADAAMYRAKRDGGNCSRLFKP